VQGTIAKVKELGGTILMEMAIPTVGAFAVCKDPQGVVFAVFQPEETTPGHDGPPAVGEFSWCELLTDGWEGAWSFYSDLFEWEKTDAMDMGDKGMYQMFGRGAHPIGGMMNKPDEWPAVSWLFYIRVADIEAAARKVKELGGSVSNGPMEVPGGDMIAQCMDPAGAAFAMHSTAAS
jgi:predicted enzyme related to lactoylglutathione lyase